MPRDSAAQRLAPPQDDLLFYEDVIELDYFAGGGITTPYSVPRYGERAGQDPRCQRLDVPMSTIVTTANQGSLVQPRYAAMHIAKHYTGVVGTAVEKPLSTVTAIDHHSLVASSLVHLRGTCKDASQ